MKSFAPTLDLGKSETNTWLTFDAMAVVLERGVRKRKRRGKGEGGRFSGLGLIFSSEYDQSFFSQLMVCQESNVPMKQATSIMPL
ncbi:hypothetical protein, partial [Novipirellula herctigrandis]|uniref:hypothetical protein n=1 Tax=Novipirellula herctigrandis TaxID=2527986 RepID=UPI003AF4030B